MSPGLVQVIRCLRNWKYSNCQHFAPPTRINCGSTRWPFVHKGLEMLEIWLDHVCRCQCHYGDLTFAQTALLIQPFSLFLSVFAKKINTTSLVAFSLVLFSKVWIATLCKRWHPNIGGDYSEGDLVPESVVNFDLVALPLSSDPRLIFWL